jgi:hypothetical protein
MPDMRAHEGEHSLDRRRLDHRRKGLTEVDAGMLRKAADDLACFIVRQRTICIIFVPENPFSSNHISVRMTRNASPCLIRHQSIVLRLHHRASVGITKGCTDGGMEQRDGGVGHIGRAGLGWKNAKTRLSNHRMALRSWRRQRVVLGGACQTRRWVGSGWQWYVSNVSIIFDAPCLFYSNCFVFCLHFMAFYAFSGTNLLTRCHSANSLFSPIFVF